MHEEKSTLAGVVVKLAHDIRTTRGVIPAGTEYMVEDWWDHLTGKSWGMSDANPACLIYAIRIATQEFPVPPDDEVLYGHIDGFGHLVHMTEIDTSEVDR